MSSIIEPTKPMLTEALVNAPAAPTTFRAFVEAHQRAVYYISLDLTGSHHDAEDLVQEVFIKAHKALDEFRGDARPITWLRKIAVNTYLNKQRKKALRFMRFFGDVQESDWQPALCTAPEQSAEQSLIRHHVEAALTHLSPRERSAFILRHYQHLTLREVAEAMGCAEGSVKSLLHRAVRKLRKHLAPYRADLGLPIDP